MSTPATISTSGSLPASSEITWPIWPQQPYIKTFIIVLLRLLCELNPEISHGFGKDLFIAVLHLGKRHTERTCFHSHHVQSGFGRNRVHFTEQSVDQRDRVDLDLRGTFDVALQEFHDHIMCFL